jgi:phosphoglycerol geranylgeranyltransferase
MRFKMGRVEQRLVQTVESHGSAHLTLIDPDSQSPPQSAEIAQAAALGGTDGIMVGGSVGVAGMLLHETVRQIKERIDLPVILFPSSVSGLCENADAVFFMSLLNSRSTSYIIENQALGAPLVKRYGLEPIPMAYIIIEPGGTVGWVGDARAVPRAKPELAAAYALAGRYLGMRLVYLEAGSGAPTPVPPATVSMVKKALGDALLVTGGGIRDGSSAAELVKAGADVIVTGTATERCQDVTALVSQVKEAMHLSKA